MLRVVVEGGGVLVVEGKAGELFGGVVRVVVVGRGDDVVSLGVEAGRPRSFVALERVAEVMSLESPRGLNSTALAFSMLAGRKVWSW